jgi:hypothetical protein
MEEKDSDYFFGRERETIEVIGALTAAPDRLPVLFGNSGVGKSSLAQAGVLAAFKRQAWPETAPAPGTWPPAFAESRRWCFLTLRPGADPLKALVEAFLHTWQFDPTDPGRETRRDEWIKGLFDRRNTMSGLLDATEGRLEERGQTKPPAFFLYVDQGEELYARAEEKQRNRFSELIAQGVADPRLYALMSLRADFFGKLLDDKALYGVHRKIDVPPLREAELRDVVSRPAELLSARFETDRLADDIARRTVEESTKDADALPLLSYLLDDMWTQMVHRGDGVLRLPTQGHRPRRCAGRPRRRFPCPSPQLRGQPSPYFHETGYHPGGRRTHAAPCASFRVLRRGMAARHGARRPPEPPPLDCHARDRRAARAGGT